MFEVLSPLITSITFKIHWFVWTKDPVLTEEDEMHLLAAMPGWLYIDTRGNTQATLLQVCNAYLSIHRSMSVIMGCLD